MNDIMKWYARKSTPERVALLGGAVVFAAATGGALAYAIGTGGVIVAGSGTVVATGKAATLIAKSVGRR